MRLFLLPAVLLAGCITVPDPAPVPPDHPASPAAAAAALPPAITAFDAPAVPPATTQEGGHDHAHH